MIHNTVGKPVKGEDFFNRKTELEQIWQRLETDDILLLAPRRVGKTSLMLHLQEKAAEHGYQALYISVADASTELAFARKLLAEIKKHALKKNVLSALKKSPVSRFLGRVRKIGISVFELELTDDAQAHWALAAEAILGVLSASGSKWLVLVDEVPIFVLALLRADASGARAREFLNWFRTLRQQSESSAKVRWLLAGSIGLDTVTRRMNLGDTINDLFLFEDFGAFDEPTAFDLLDRLAASYSMTLDDDVKRRICDRTGWLIPYHLQLAFSELKPPGPTVADVDAVFDQLLSPAKKSYFDFWRQRLTEELGPPHDAWALKLLGAIAANDEGASAALLSGVLSSEVQADERSHQVTYLVDVLVSDGYIVHLEDRYRFRSTLLRDYWRRYVL